MITVSLCDLRHVVDALFVHLPHSVAPPVLVVDTPLFLLPMLLALLARWLALTEEPLALVPSVSKRCLFHSPMPKGLI